jgi:hypothetical protein
MKSIVFILMATVFLRPISWPDKNRLLVDCSKYKTGVFSYHFKSDGKILYYTLTRSDSFQIEKNDQNGNISKFKINWIGNCTYELSFLEGTELLPKELLDMKKRLIIRTTILESGKNYYLFKSTGNVTSHILQDTIWTKR